MYYNEKSQTRKALCAMILFEGAGQVKGVFQQDGAIAGLERTKYLRGRGDNHYNFRRWGRKPAHP
jgi:hypothetical protein